MKKTAITGGIILMFLATAMMASAYHIPDPSPARSWTNPGIGIAITQCESTGSTDPINPLPVASGGLGGLCYASCEHFETKEAKKAKKNDTDFQDTYCAISPKCLTGDCTPGGGLAGEEEKPSDGGLFGDWFARAGSNTRSCTGEWGQAAVFKQALLYYGGSGPNSNGISGHATFFITTAGTTGTYNYEKPYDLQLPNAKTMGNCSGNDVHLVDDDLKP